MIAKQVDGVIKANRAIKIDSCAMALPIIVLVVGESANRHHSQLYGYPLSTTLHQLALKNGKDSLAVFTGVVSPWNLTSRELKQLSSLQSVGEKSDWSNYALFPAVFKKAGYVHYAYLAGIKTKDYQREKNLISPHFNNTRYRLVLQNIDYDRALMR